MAVNANQERHILATFAYVDGLLEDVARLAQGIRSPFAKEQADLAPEETRLLMSFVAVARTRMLAALDHLHIARPSPITSARWSVSTSLTFADVALSEITESSLRGYGAIDPAVSAEIVALAADLRALVERGKALLHEFDSGGLRDRVAALQGPIGDVLRTLERISAERGLAEVRPLIAVAVERATSMTFDVGIFGRVSAGKSSLINALMGTPILPVGATPVTAVPIRITRGSSAATVIYYDGATSRIEIADIPAYASEAQNPQNKKGVRAIEVEVLSVPEGLRFLDTPGVGSLGSSGPAQTFAWLPRCDLGLVLIAAGTAVASDDLALVAGLGNAGIACRILLSKADLLSAAELERAMSYVRAEFAAILGPKNEVALLPVSVAHGHTAPLETVRRDVLAPLAATHARAARDALHARLHRLVAATAAASRGRTNDIAAPRDVYKARAAAMDVVRRETDRLSAAGDAVLKTAASAVADAWTNGGDARSAARVSILGAGAQAVSVVRKAIDDAVVDAGGNVEPGDAGRRRLPPLFDPDFLDALPSLTPPPIARRLVGERFARNHLEPIAAPLRAALSRYAGRLHVWGAAQLDELTAPAVDDVAPSGAVGDELAALDARIDSGTS